MQTVDLKNIDDLMLHFAAKSDYENKKQWLPLWVHLYDTAIVMEFLQDNWISSVYKGHECNEEQIKKIGIFIAAIHDMGKLIPAFQNMIAPNISEYKELLTGLGVDISAHYTEEERKRYGHHAYGTALLLCRYGLCKEVAIVVAGHHGIIPDRGFTDSDNYTLDLHQNLFFYKGNKEKSEELYKSCIDYALKISGYESLEDIPVIDKELQLLMTGLLITADWIASNKTYFPLIDISTTKEDLMFLYPLRGNRGINELKFSQKWEIDKQEQIADLVKARFGFDANNMQIKVQEVARSIESPAIFIVEAPMGTGKTEASLAVAEIFARKMGKSGLAFFLPSQATSNALFSRLESWAENQLNGRTLSLQLAHKSFLLNNDFEELYRCGYENTGNPELIAHQFFCGSKSFLLANFVVGTIDQLLMAAVKQKHVMLKHLGLADKVVIIDECHAYDAYMNTYLDRILNYLYRYNVPVVILSATLPANRREQLLRAYGKNNSLSCDEEGFVNDWAYPLISWSDGDRTHSYTINSISEEKNVQIRSIVDDEIIGEVKKAFEAGACVGIIVNTVFKAQKLSEEINRFANDKMILLHAQYLLPDRVIKEEEILEVAGKTSVLENRRGTIIIGTQVLEQSLDIDFDVLFTDVCPMDLLLQRIGRLQRHNRIRPHGYELPVCYVIGKDEKIVDKATATIYGEYLIEKTKSLLPSIITIPTDISSLVQRLYDENNISEDLKKNYEDFKSMREEQEEHARGCLLDPIVYGRRIPKTIEGLIERSVSEDSARASVREGDPSIEVLVLAENGEGRFKFVSEKYSGLYISDSFDINSDMAKTIAKQRLRLPHCLSNKWNGSKIIDYLRMESSEKLQHIQNNPWLKNELFLILDENYEKTLINQYRIKYYHEYGLVVMKGE